MAAQFFSSPVGWSKRSALQCLRPTRRGARANRTKTPTEHLRSGVNLVKPVDAAQVKQSVHLRLVPAQVSRQLSLTAANSWPSSARS